MRVEGHKLIAECLAYDFKKELERKKIRDWLKSISEKVNAHLDPLPEWSLIPHEIEGKAVIEAAVKEGNQTPYYLNLDGTRITGRWRPSVATRFWRRCSPSWTIWRREAAV